MCNSGNEFSLDIENSWNDRIFCSVYKKFVQKSTLTLNINHSRRALDAKFADPMIGNANKTSAIKESINPGDVKIAIFDVPSRAVDNGLAVNFPLVVNWVVRLGLTSQNCRSTFHGRDVIRANGEVELIPVNGDW